MNRLMTPMGKISIRIDGEEIQYFAVKGRKSDILFPDIVGRYFIKVHLEPDSKEHEISCILIDMPDVNKSPESGERLEMQGFYSKSRWKLSIGCEGETGYFPDGTRLYDEYDYDIEYLDNGMAYQTFTNTRTSLFVFGIAWIDDAGWDDELNDENNRDVQTWFAADPTIASEIPVLSERNYLK